jgi:hypothetical protein
VGSALHGAEAVVGHKQLHDYLASILSQYPYQMHHNTHRTASRCRVENIGAVMRSFYKVIKASLHCGLHLNFPSFSKSLVIGLAILEKFGMNRQ